MSIAAGAEQRIEVKRRQPLIGSEIRGVDVDLPRFGGEVRASDQVMVSGLTIASISR